MNNRLLHVFLPPLLGVFLLSATACGAKNGGPQGAEGDAAGVADTLAYAMKRVEKIYNEGKNPGDGDSYCRCSWPVFSGGNGAEAINRRIHAWIADSTSLGPGKGSTVEELAERFLMEYDTFRKEFDTALPYQFDLEGRVVLNRPGILTVDLSVESYTGGAHGNRMTRYLVFDTRTGKRLAPADVFREGFQEPLNRLIDSRYREMTGLSETERLDGEKGRLFENYIHFNDNFALTPEGVTFYYNNYEIAAYAFGPTVIGFSYGELADLLRPGFEKR